MDDFRKNGKNKYKIRVKRRLPFFVRFKIKVRAFKQKINSIFLMRRKKTQRAKDMSNSEMVNNKVKRKGKKGGLIKPVIVIFLALVVVFVSILFLNVAKKKDIDVAEKEKQIESMVPKNITLHYGTKTYDVFISQGTLKDVIEKAGLTITDEYEIIPDVNTNVRYFDEAWVIMYQEKVVTKIIDTNYNVVQILDEEKKTFERDVITVGKVGQTELTLKRIYKNGILFSQITLNETVIKEPVDEVVSVGKIKSE